MDKKQLSERDICTKFITPALRQAGWDEMTQFREEVSFTKGRILVRGQIVKRGQAKRADYILYAKPHIPLAVIEAKDNDCSVGDGLQQALGYAETLQLPFVFSSNGDGFVFHDRTVPDGPLERNLHLDEFPSPGALWAKYRAWKGLSPETEPLVLQDYYSDGSERGPRY
jgi:type I restriction enzyme, R subunit